MESSPYFHMDNIWLETSVRWLFQDVVSYKMEVGVYEKFGICNSDFNFVPSQAARVTHTHTAASISRKLLHKTQDHEISSVFFPTFGCLISIAEGNQIDHTINNY